ncbi:type VI secretion system-associated protein TagO [Pseudomonas sp. ICMP 8385]|uniref:type VI secretion system-associated protein TagO n=1 Tax=Pseudomonas sp. ICMP 8385 TaxID=1718920 RepID=UPI00159BD1BC|nr:type VI secretion system-associated protein TagO [Pseudomonas sp. ICMP 8385]
MKKNGITTVMLLLAPLVASAAIEDKQVALCASMSGSVERLACYDEIASTNNLAPKTVATTSAGKGQWSTSTSTDPLTDKSIYIAILDASSGRGRFGDGIDLVVRCSKGQTDFYINWASFLGTESISVTHRIGRAKAVKSSWVVSTDHKSSFFPGSPVASLKAMIGADTFVANVTPYSENPITATFDISGAGEAMKEIRTACKW